MTEIHEMSDAELMDLAETWLNLELRRIPRKLALTPTQMMQVVLRCNNKVIEDYLKNIKEAEDNER